jgi:hypothetical protein
VGIQTYGSNDAPYWPADNCYNFKEVWVHPSARWLWLMCDLAGPGRVLGKVKPSSAQAVEFRDALTGATAVACPDSETGEFEVSLGEGMYRVLHEGREKKITLLPGEKYRLDLRELLDFEVSQETLPDGQVTIKVNAEGDGRARFAVRAQNLQISPRHLGLTLKPTKPQTLSWRAKVISRTEPWVAVVVPNGDLAEREEVIGSIPQVAEK